MSRHNQKQNGSGRYNQKLAIEDKIIREMDKRPKITVRMAHTHKRRNNHHKMRRGG